MKKSVLYLLLFFETLCFLYGVERLPDKTVQITTDPNNGNSVASYLTRLTTGNSQLDIYQCNPTTGEVAYDVYALSQNNTVINHIHNSSNIPCQPTWVTEAITQHTLPQPPPILYGLQDGSSSTILYDPLVDYALNNLNKGASSSLAHNDRPEPPPISQAFPNTPSGAHSNTEDMVHQLRAEREAKIDKNTTQANAFHDGFMQEVKGGNLRDHADYHARGAAIDRNEVLVPLSDDWERAKAELLAASNRIGTSAECLKTTKTFDDVQSLMQQGTQILDTSKKDFHKAQDHYDTHAARWPWQNSRHKILEENAKKIAAQLEQAKQIADQIHTKINDAVQASSITTHTTSSHAQNNTAPLTMPTTVTSGAPINSTSRIPVATPGHNSSEKKSIQPQPKRTEPSFGEKMQAISTQSLESGLCAATEFAAETLTRSAIQWLRGDNSDHFTLPREERRYAPRPDVEAVFRNLPRIVFDTTPTLPANVRSLSPTSMRMEKAIITGNDGQQISLSKLKQKIATTKLLSQKLAQDAVNQPRVIEMSKAIDVFNELAAHFASAGDEESALLFSNIARHNLTIAKDFLKDLASASVNATPKALLRLTSPEHWTGFATSTAECAFNIASTLGESIEASESFSLDQLNTLDKRYHERAEILKRTIAAHIQNVKAMSRQQLLERGIEEGIVFFGDFIACKGLSLLAHGNLTERAFVELDATTAQLQKVLRNADPLTQHHVMEIVNCGKIRLECGQSIGEEALSCLGDTPELLNQNGKTVSQVVEEVAGEVATRVEQKVSTAVDASTPVGRRGMNPTPRVQNGLRTPTIIYGREYSAHAIERIQERGLTPMVVENAIKTGLTKQNKLPGNLEHFDEINNITVITCEKTGKVVTVF